MAIKVVLANKKGGVGKTTTAANLSAILASRGYRVLTIDFDPQSNLTICFGINILSLGASLADVFDDNCSMEDAIVSGVFDNLDILPTIPAVEKVCESSRVMEHLRKNEIIKFKLAKLKGYDFVIMDTPPAKNVLTMNSLAIADYVVVPIRLDQLSTAGLKQMHDLVRDVKEQWLNPDIDMLGLLCTFYEYNTDVREHMDILQRSSYKDYLFDTKIRKNVMLRKSISRGLPIVHYNRNCHGFWDYDEFTSEFLARLESKRSRASVAV
jgi:chromosome partitioning protein